MKSNREVKQEGRSRSIVWTEEDLEYLCEHWADCSLASISDYLVMAPGTVKRKADELGLKKSPDFNAAKLRYNFVKRYKNGGYKERYENYMKTL